MNIKKFIKKIIDKGFIKDTGIVAQVKLYYYEGKPYFGYVIYNTSVFFWVTCYKYFDSVPDSEELDNQYKGIKVIY
jgi:hypothetical protein